jgi:hypothetical protein
MAFENRLLDKLFSAVLENRQIPIDCNLEPTEEKVLSALDYLPISLSPCQRDAVRNAWRSEISYIQGPPGTGKSHTITATMLSAVFLGKRVLMVSHKRPAVEIVRRMLEERLGPGSVIYLGPLAEQKKKLRGDIQRWLAELGTVDALRRQQEKRATRDAHEQEVRSLLREVREMEAELKAALEHERDYFAENEAFLRRRRDFEQVYRTLGSDRLRLAEWVRDPRLFKHQLERTHRVLLDTRTKMAGYLPRKEWLHLRRLFGACAKEYFADRSRLVPDGSGTLYLREHLDLTLTYQAAVTARLKVTDDFLNQHRRALAYRVGRLERKKKQLARSQLAVHVLDNIAGRYEDVQRFDRLLYWRNPHRIAEVMDRINYDALTRAFPLWVGEMRHLGEFLPFVSELFDLVIVDEASQVNIAEIIPAFYRGKRFCVVGDKKQLGLSSVGLFALNRTFEELIWNEHFARHGVTHVQAGERSVLVSKSSILDFVTASNSFTPKRAVLNEHYRSLPQLASFTSDHFYQDDGGLLLMKETPKNVRKECFQKMEVGGQRDPDNKVVQKEVDELIRWLKFLIRQRGYLEDTKLRQHTFSPSEPPTIGVISFLTNQRNFIQTRIEEEFQEDEIKAHDLMVGTPEDFQGNERNIIFLTLGLDGTRDWSRGHYENPNRFNVATSRAINFTYLVFGGMPANASRLKHYLRHFGESWSTCTATEDEPMPPNPAVGRFAWRYNPALRESEFEIRVDGYLHEFVRQNGGTERIKIYNQVGASGEPGVCSCGQKRLDFVLFNEQNGECCAVEVDGCDHFCAEGRRYSEAHLERVDILKRAGWKIAHVPYYHWYRAGWLCDSGDPKFQRHMEGLFAELRTLLGV